MYVDLCFRLPQILQLQWSLVTTTARPHRTSFAVVPGLAEIGRSEVLTVVKQENEN
jgi:hypothetical protein